ncbi:Altered inheritance of mitochondria protein 41 mitochondrial [Epicoccum nigrum]|nr:Altered inheritance of mitochondria protein 41 mitochondrial [Epicoccum nigrum]
MALFRPTMLRTAFSASQSTCLRYATLRYSSTAASESVVLPRLQSDLKTAMRAKNKPALNVIRALQAEIINASKTAKPIENDGTFYALVQKKIKEANATIEECTAAKREDLVEKEQAHLDVLNKYAEDIPKVPEAELNGIIDQAVAGFEEAKRAYGPIMGKVMGAIKGRPHDIDYVQKKVEELVGKK